MNKIKFSFDYEKLPIGWNGTQAVLVGVCHVDMDRIKKSMPAFIEYDTTHRGGHGKYALDFKEGIILSFIHLNTGKPFTTIRRNTKEKFEWYMNCLGETFEMVLL
jgi:hypothetical protein